MNNNYNRYGPWWKSKGI